MAGAENRLPIGFAFGTGYFITPGPKIGANKSDDFFHDFIGKFKRSYQSICIKSKKIILITTRYRITYSMHICWLGIQNYIDTKIHTTGELNVYLKEEFILYNYTYGLP